MSNLPSNHLYNLPPQPPQNCQVRFTLKSSVQFTPPKSPSPIYPQIARSDLPSNHLYNLPPQPPPKLPSPIYTQIAKSDLPLKSSVRFTPPKSDLPSNRQVRFTLKLPSPIYPQIICTIYPPSPPKLTSPFYNQIICTIYPQIVCMVTNFTSLGISNGL